MMGTVIQLKKQINNSYADLKNSVEDKLILVEEKINSRLASKVDLVQKMTRYHLKTGGKRLRALLTLQCAKICEYKKGLRDVNLAACVELIHAATLMHDDVIDSADIRRGKKTLNTIWGNHSSILVGDYLLSKCFEMMVEDGNLELLKLLATTSSEIAQGEVLQLQHNKEIDILEETYLNIISSKTASLFAAATKVGAKLFGKNIGNDFYEGKVTLPIILLYQKVDKLEKEKLKSFFEKDIREKQDLEHVLDLIKKNNVINECYKKAEHYINLASNSLSVFEESDEKNILKSLTSFSIERNFSGLNNTFFQFLLFIVYFNLS